MENKRKEKILACMCLFITIYFSIMFFVKFLINTSVGADNQKIIIEANLDKYINYEISDQDKGTLIQYNVRTGIEYGNEDYIPLKSSELAINLNQIDGKYPYAVKIITNSTELTNGKTENIEDNYEYDSNTGIIMIGASNQDENGDIINTTKPSDIAKDDYVIIAYYDTYTEQEEERELDIKVQSTITLSIDDRKITQENEFKGLAKDNIEELTSVTAEGEEIYNGYIKSNIINGTNYDTEYKETAKIMVSKKEAQEKIEFKESNSFERIYQNSNGEEITEEFSSNGDLVYKSTKIKQQDIKRLLGENGVVEILDGNSNLIATIDQNTQFAEDGSVVINYENEPESIIVKTSEIKNEGILPIENTKKIKSTMKNMDYNKIKTAIEINGIKEEVATNGEEETKEEKILFTNHHENTSDIKESINNINIDISNTEWTNKNQNEVTFNVYMSANSTKDNMLKDPSIKIELPSEVEKVILGEASVVYANGLKLQDPYLEINENGNIVIVANLLGTQTSYDGNTLGLVTDVKISATVILKKYIENTMGNVNLIYTNYYTVNGKAEIENRSNDIKIASYKEENIVDDNSEIATYANTSLLASTIENVEGLTVEVTPVRGDTVLKDGDTVYEGEFIKYNVTVTNTSDKQIDNIKVVGTVPEGTIYGELEADYHTGWANYDYKYNNTIKEKTIKIGSLEPGKSSIQFYEIKVNDLDEGQEEKQIQTEIKTYVNEEEVSNYEITNIVNTAEVQVFLAANLDNDKDRWNYHVKLKSKTEKELTVKLQVPEQFELGCIVHDKITIRVDDKIQISDDNIITTTLELNSETEEEWIFEGTIDSSKVKAGTEESKVELKAIATIVDNDVIYKSNENRILFEYESASIVMNSDNEGEEVKYKDEINYEIKVTNTGKTNLDDPLYSYISIKLTDYLPENVNPISLVYENWEEEQEDVDEETGSYIPTGRFSKVTATKDISAIYTDENGNRLPNVDLNLIIPYGESVIIKVKTTAGYTYEKTKVENNATVIGNSIDVKTSNTITHTILPYDYEESEDPDDPSNPDNPNNPDNPGDNDEKYSISGVAWLDKNEDGKKQTSEKFLDGITVMLVNTANSSTIQAKEVTDSNGAYRFSELEEGNYIVVFNYDTDTYSVTEYQKSGVSNSLNSDAISKEITLMGVNTKVGLTDTISLDASVSNVDIGLIENKICDLKLDKYISKVQVKTASGTKEYTYDNNQLAKIEIKSKEIQGATVVVTYKIVVTNEGELPAYVTKVLDYIPEGLDFSSDLNKSWTTTKTGELTNISIANQSIGAGESVELTLVLTKTMTSNSTGTFTNIAEIGEMSNSLRTRDTDSIPGNKVENEDDYSKADLIISISTGEFVIYISFFIGILVVIGISIKFGILKIVKRSLFGVILVSMVFLNSTTILATDYPEPPTYVRFQNEDVSNYNSSYFYATDPEYVGRARCINQGADVPDDARKYEFFGLAEEKTKISVDESGANLELIKENSDDDIEIKQVSGNYILGPFQVTRSNSNEYTYQVETSKKTGDKALIGETCDEDGTTTTVSGNRATFYIKIPVNKIDEDEQINKVVITAKVTVTTTTTTYAYGYAKYKVCEGPGGSPLVWTYQDIKTLKVFYKKTREDKTTDEKSKGVEWIIKNGDLEVEKVDSDNKDIKMEGIKFYLKKEDTGLYVKEDGIISYVENRNSATLFETGEYGKRKIKSLRAGDYIIEEISNPYYGYNLMATSKTKVRGGMTNTYELENEKQTGNLQIEKQDSNSKEGLSGISFKIKMKIDADINQDGVVDTNDITALQLYMINNSEESKRGDLNRDGKVNDEDVTLLQEYMKNQEIYIIVTDSNGEYKGKEVTGTINLTKTTTTTNSNEATTFTTDDNGKINILNMLAGDYYLEETSIGNNFGYADPSDAKDQSEGFEKYIEYEYTATDKDGNEKRKPGNGNDMFITIESQDSRETEAGAISTNEIKYSNKLNVYNKQKYIKLSGYAWEDMYHGKQSDRNDLYNDGEADIDDKLLQYVIVRLCDKNGNKIDEKVTNQDGEFTFGNYDEDPTIKKIKIEDLSAGAYVQFYYNGLNYETVALNCIDTEGTKVDNGNTAREFEVNRSGNENSLRERYNANYGYVENNKTLKEDASNGIGLNYNYNGAPDYSSKLNYGAGTRYGYEGAEYPIATSWSNEAHSDQFYITARTETNMNTTNKQDYRLLGQNRTIDEILADGLDEITNINLGLYKREQPDLAIAQDINNVELSINGYTHTYEYANRFSDVYTNKIDTAKYPGGIYNVGVKFGTKYGSESYSRTVYESDCKYTGDNKLQAYVTYKIAINNQATTLESRVNSLLEYYDKNYYTISSAYLEDDTGLRTELHCEPISYDSNDYAKVRIDTYDESRNADLRIGTTGGDTEYVYVRFEIKDIGSIFFDESGIKKLDVDEIVLKTYAEINSYSTFYNKDYGKEENEDPYFAGKTYAGIDKDSNPGNFNTEAEREENKQLEDDTDVAPSLIITADKARKISGTVFLDESVLDKVTSNPDTYTRNGNGEYEEGEKGISGVKVELYKTTDINEDGSLNEDAVPVGTTTYNENSSEGTASEGYFEISGFIPGDYVIVYTWGDRTYIAGDQNNPINVNDYKGTIYKEKQRADKVDWYRNYPEDEKWRSTRYSDAMDDYKLRQTIDGENSMNISKMNSITPAMRFGIEYKDDINNYINDTINYKGESNHLLNNEDEIEPENSKLTFDILNVDFGITERARQQIDIDKRVKTVKITLANGQTIVDAEVEETKDSNGNIKYQLKGNTIKGLNYMGPSKDNTPRNGYLNVQIDSELIQGSILEIGYEIVVKNNSEVDYATKDYYLYGTPGEESNIIKVKPTGVYDYLDKSMAIDRENEENNNWTTIEQEDYNNSIITTTGKTIIEEYLAYASKTTEEDGTTTEVTGYTSSYEEYYEDVEDWSSGSVELKKARQNRLADKTILQNKQLEGELAELTPGNSKTASLYATKVLSNNNEIVLDNDVEVTQVERTGTTGRKVTPFNSTLYDKAETITITTPTGENRDYTPIIILGISSFIILGTGIVFIKKKILG